MDARPVHDFKSYLGVVRKLRHAFGGEGICDKGKGVEKVVFFA